MHSFGILLMFVTLMKNCRRFGSRFYGVQQDSVVTHLIVVDRPWWKQSCFSALKINFSLPLFFWIHISKSTSKSRSNAPMWCRPKTFMHFRRGFNTESEENKRMASFFYFFLIFFLLSFSPFSAWLSFFLSVFLFFVLLIFFFHSFFFLSFMFLFFLLFLFLFSCGHATL